MKALLALICGLGFALMGPAAAYAAGQKKQQQNRAPPYTGQASAYHGAVAGAGHVNVPANKSLSTGKPTGTPKPNAIGKRTAVGQQPGNKTNKYIAEPTPRAMSTNAARNAATRSRTEPRVNKAREHQTFQTSTGLPTAGLPKWNFPIKARPDLTLTPIVSTSNSARKLFDVNRGIPNRLVTLAPMTPESNSPFEHNLTLANSSVLGASIPPNMDVRSGHLPGQPGGPAGTAVPMIIPGLSGNPGGSDSMGNEGRGQTGQSSGPVGSDSVGDGGAPYGNPANGTSTDMSTSQPINMANNPEQTAMSARIPSSVANEQRTSERAAAGQFQQNRRIQGSDQWVDSDYDVFRNYRSEWHDRDWWRTHQPRIIYCVGGWYYWNEGYWFPAWGYAPEADYAYDGPIYGYKEWPPDQVTATVQGTLQKQGYYQGESDGLLSSPTSTALVDYQRDHGLYETSTIDRPTSQSLGMK